MKNNVENNVLQDCGILICDLAVSLQPNEYLILTKDDLLGLSTEGATFQYAFTLEKESYIGYNPIISTSENCTESNTTNSSYCYKQTTQIGINEVTRYRTVEKKLTDKIYTDKDKETTIYLRYTKDSPDVVVDLFPKIKNTLVQEWAIWNSSSWNYSQVIPTSMLYGRANITSTLNNYLALVTLNTTNTTLFNVSNNCSNVRIIDVTNTIELNITYNSGCGSFPTYFFVEIPAQTNTTEIVVYAGNLQANSTSNETNTFSNATSRYDMTKLTDSLFNNSLQLINDGGGSDAVINISNVACKFGNCLQISPDTRASNLSAKLGSTTKGTMSCWVNRSGANYGNNNGLFAVGDNGGAIGGGVFYIYSTQAPDANGFKTYIGGSHSNSASFTWAQSRVNQTYYAMSWDGTTLTVFSAEDEVAGYSFDSNVVGTAVSLGGIQDIWIGSTKSGDFGAGGFFDECRLYNDPKTEEWHLATSALVYNDSGIWESTVSANFQPTIYNETNGTQFYANNDLIGWTNITDDDGGLWNVSFRWFVDDVLNETGTINNLLGNASGISHNIANISTTQTEVGQVWILEVNATNQSNNISSVNSSSITIINFPIEITQFDFTSNGSAYILGEVEANVTLIDIDVADELNLSWNWYKNGVNQTGLAGSAIVANNTPYNLNAGQSPYTAGDNWSISIQATDGTITTPDNSSANTTIQDYFQNISVAFTNPQADTASYENFLNGTLAKGILVTASLYFGGLNTSATSSNISNDYKFNVTAQPEPGPNTQNATWYATISLLNGSSYIYILNHSVTVQEGGIFLCGTETNTTSITIEVFDEQTGIPINSTILTQIEPYPGKTQSYETDGFNQTLCIFPPNQNFTGGLFTTATASNYSARSITREITFSNVSQTIQLFLLNDTLGAFYTFTVVDQFELPITEATILIERFLSSTNQSETIAEISTNPDGTGTAFLLTQVPYEIMVSEEGFVNLSFTFTPAAISTLTIQLTPSSVLNRTPVEYENQWNNVSYNLEPDTYTQNESFNITLSILDNSSSLEYWGMKIDYVNGSSSTEVYNVNQTSSIGGIIFYTATENGTYVVNFWLKKEGFREFAPASQRYYLGPSRGLLAVGKELSTGNVISGWGFYFLFLILAMAAGGFISKFSYEGSAYVSLIILWTAVIIWPDAPLSEAGFFIITSFHATLLTTLATLGGGTVFRGV